MTAARSTYRYRTALRRTAVCGATLLLAATGRPAGAADGDAFDPFLSLCLAGRMPVQPDTVWAAWSLAPEVLLPLLGMLALYGWGLSARWQRADRATSWQGACFALGWLALAIALLSPLCRLAATLASAHMVQHVILVAVAPPLLVLGRPGATAAAVLPRWWRTAFSRAVRTRPFAAARRWIATPAASGALYGAAIWFWHVPAFYEAALANEAVHLTMYATLLAASLPFWRMLIVTLRRAPGKGGSIVLVVLATTMHTGLLGALLTFAPTPLYPVFAAQAAGWGMTPLEDQQLAGLVMWVPMGVIYLIGSVYGVMTWLHAAESEQERRFSA